MKRESGTNDLIVKICLARKVANHAKGLGITHAKPTPRPHSSHLGAVMADSILQAGLSYRTVVYPRVSAIIRQYPEACDLDGVEQVIASGRLPEFLMWRHDTKLTRFQNLAVFLREHSVQAARQLRTSLCSENFRNELLKLSGIGEKTVDYMSCLVGNDEIAVDRHIRRFAKDSGVEVYDYSSLHTVFSLAADLLTIPRREFDSWIWATVSENSAAPSQLSLQI